MAAAAQRELSDLTQRLQELAETRTTLSSQLNENEGVKKELDLLKPGAKLFRALGPGLVPTEVGDAKELVGGRIKKISESIAAVEVEFEAVGKQRQELIAKLRAQQQPPPQHQQQQQQQPPPPVGTTATARESVIAGAR